MGVTQELMPQSAKLILIYITEAGEPQNDSMVPVGVLACSGQLKAPNRAVAIPDLMGRPSATAHKTSLFKFKTGG